MRFPEHGDVTDFINLFASGEEAAKRLAILIEGAPEYDPTIQQPQEADQPDDPWEMRTLADAFKPRPPLQCAIAGLFPLPSMSILYGPPGTMKSMLMGSALLHVAGGIPWLGRKVIQSPTMWLDIDNGKRRTDERFEALARYLKLNEHTPFFYYSMPTPMFNAGDIEAITLMANRMISRSIKMLVIDNLGTASLGAEENSNGMVQVMGNLRHLSEITEAAIIVIHHQRKSKGNARDGETLRGHSSIEAALDLALLVEREENSDMITVRSTKTRDVEVFPFGAEFRYEHKPDSDELMTACFVYSELEQFASDANLEKFIIETLQESSGMSQSAVVEKVQNQFYGVGKNSIRNRLSKMVAKHKLKVVVGAHNVKLYYTE